MAKVKVYSTPTCPWCKKTKELLNENSIGFEDINVAADSKAAQEMFRKSGQMGVPVTDIDGQIIVGFDKLKLKQLLKISG
ncbi:glutathione S-transferase N-terminal domain-containing protein [Candidatus Woesearchaeota archaeon]|nr:glutathione S-transferase N-terminal domain-containing protein [Candidatus Woesearchaeota archaeon]